jgi:hypothetical protein
MILFLCISSHSNTTTDTSYPACCNDPQADQDECINYNGCKWAGYFYALEDQQTEQWVKNHDIVAFYDDSNRNGSKWKKRYANRRMRLTKTLKDGSVVEFEATALDTCGNSDCKKCCKKNSKKGFLVDVEKYTAKRWFGEDYEDKVVGKIKWEFLN